MKKIYLLFFILNAAAILTSTAQYQYAGGSITYINQGGYQYEIDITLYHDCGGSAMPVSIPITGTSSCGNNFSVNAYQVGYTTVNTFCTGQLTTCQGGTVMGIQKWTYSTTLTLPVGCADWTFSYSGNYRNSEITTISSPQSTPMYLEAHLNNLSVQNTSAQYGADAILFPVTKKPVCFNIGATDANNDSLVYSLISPRIDAINSVTFVSPYTYTSPLYSSPSLTLNSQTGAICFTPDTEQTAILAVLVKEYRSGVMVGQTIRDIEIVVRDTIGHPILSGFQILTPNGVFPVGTTGDTIAECNIYKTYWNIYGSSASSGDLLIMTVNQGNIPYGSPSISGSPGKSPSLYWDMYSSFPPGVYTFSVTLKDIHCPTIDSITRNYTIVVGVAATISSTPVGCHNAGSATITVTAGSGNYSYLWSSNQTTSSITGIGAGNYSVVVTDKRTGCTTSQSVNVSGPNYSLSVSSTQTSCATPTGTATVNVTGGTSPFSYLWNNGQTNYAATALAAGAYTVTVTDANTCTLAGYVIVNNINGPAASTTSTPAACVQPTGTATVNATAGTGPYTYLWNNGETTSTAITLHSGSFNVTVTDAVGCTVTAIATVSTQNTGPTLFAPQANVTCPGGNNGIASVTAIGNSPYSYLWSNGATTAAIHGLTAGPYSITVTDGGGCTSTQTITILQPPDFALTFSTSPTGCNTALGSVSLSVAGATSPYSCAWSNGQNSFSISNLSAGIYTVTVTDSKNCTTTASATVSISGGASLATTQTNISCYGATNGSATVSASGANSPYNYLWSNGSTLSSVVNLQSSNYKVTVTDKNGCTVTQSVTITQPSALTVPLSIQSGCSAASGTITLSASGGTGSYTYLWNNGQTDFTITGLGTGTYSVTVTDANSCTSKAIATITALGGLNLVLSQNNISCFGAHDGSIVISASGGSGPYHYLWSNGTTQSQASNLQPQSYLFTVTDANGCSSTASVNITEPPALVLNFRRNYYVCEASSVHLTVSGGTSYSWAPPAGLSCTACSNPLAYYPNTSTTYTVTVINGACFDTARVTVAPAPPPALPTITVVGGDTLICSQGSAYHWYKDGTPIIPAATDSFYIASNCGIYAVQVTDTNGCQRLSDNKNTCPLELLPNSGSGGEITLFPNPAGEVLFIKAKGVTKNAAVTIYNTLSQSVLSSHLFLWRGDDEASLDISSLANGVYIVQLRYGDKVYRKRMVKD